MNIGTEERPLRVAVIGAGPAGFYVADHLFKQKGLTVEVDVFDRLPTPFGLVRHGVAPDHQKIKLVTRVFEKTANHPRFRFFGHVELGSDVTVEDLREHYHQIVYTVGAQTDRNLSIPGEDLADSHSATEFVAWYNGHPDYRDHTFNLDAETVAIVGVGNVAVDVARILCRHTDELAETDIADDALEALRQSKVKEVIMLGRRGPAQAAFSLQEIKELGKMPHAQVRVPPDEATPDALTLEALEKEPDPAAMHKLEILGDFADAPDQGKPRTLTIRFLVSPTELIGDEQGHVKAMKLIHNELYLDDRGTLRPRATDRIEEIPAQLVFRSVGYHGVALPGVPFDSRRGIIPNELGRVTDPDSGKSRLGEYTAGWIKRGPTGLIGTNKADAHETGDRMLEDLTAGRLLDPPKPHIDHAADLIAQRQPEHFSYEHWKWLNDHETSLGESAGRPRVKLTTIEQMRAARDRCR